MKIKPSDVRGFNYHPYASTCAMDDWIHFDISEWRQDLTKAKVFFPKINTVRIWLSWNAFSRIGERMADELTQVFDLCRELSLYVIPCIFNRWHDPNIDCDGVYLDHFLPGSSWLQKYGNPFDKYVDMLCDRFCDEERILVWDMCNEPYAYNSDFPMKNEIKPFETKWLKNLYSKMKEKVSQPLGIGSTGGEPLSEFNDFCDVFLTHLYYQGNTELSDFDEYVASFANDAKRYGKPLISSECCWGSTDNKKRAELIKATLDTFAKYNIGFVAHALAYSLCTDLHDSEDGRVSPDIGNLAFMTKDKMIRPYHEIFNEY